MRYGDGPLAKLLCVCLLDKYKVYFFENTFKVRYNARGTESQGGEGEANNNKNLALSHTSPSTF